MKIAKIELRKVQLGTLGGSSDGWLIVGDNDVIHGTVHPIDGDLFTIASTTDERIQAFGWCPMFDSLDHVHNDVAIALAMGGAAEVEQWLEESERHDIDHTPDGHLH
ncbi:MULTISPECIES: hypothetical protein [unclassified Thalassospira]|uniref:hypothetical protein n=1 Tax=unclassified Thalassospira TaxID=2648997 RepID=UPI000A1DB7FA|nr:hypothetical protein [Thalassospira sp. MCCC 1A01428]OSQ41927.1 hypothetical protein THS27_17045 [Thalassospira sp. MCCC 1A01428]